METKLQKSCCFIQKIAMSRAFLKDAELLVLDEPTAALDPQSEFEVFLRFSDLSENKTAILITHRLGSVRMADKLIVLSDGCLVESGTHEHLLDQEGEYSDLFSMQAQNYRELELVP